MPHPVFHSQAGQDQFVHLLHPKPGTFLDIGANHPTEISNTAALEEMGWRGLCVDTDDYCAQLFHASKRQNFYHGDAVHVDWPALLEKYDLQSPVTYLSLDIDALTFEALLALPPLLRFAIITIEHDTYRFGNKLRTSERQLLRDRGYQLVVADVQDGGCPFEDWWVDPAQIASEAWKPLQAAAVDGKKFMSAHVK